jgi:hypothetical protein
MLKMHINEQTRAQKYNNFPDVSSLNPNSKLERIGEGKVSEVKTGKK